MTQVFPPGSTLGVLGSGQLGRMFALAARRLGYRVHVLSPDDDTPTGQVADVEIRAAYDDEDAVVELARGVDVVTFEFENVPISATEVVERFVPVRPNGAVLHTTQNRIREKTFLQRNGIPVSPFVVVQSLDELPNAIAQVGYPAILKTADWGYDGKGQVRIASPYDAAGAWGPQQASPCVLERFVEFRCELSVIVARGVNGSIATYGPIHNSHCNQILDVSVMPAGVHPQIASDAVDIAREICKQLDVVGVLGIEFFVTADERLLVNELAPRPHNSGHLTIDAHVTCQFEQQVRAVCGLPAGSTEQLRPAAMANLLGELWNYRDPDWSAMCSLGDVKLHLYGKRAPQPGRKMGHLTALAADGETAADRVREARRLLSGDERCVGQTAATDGCPQPAPVSTGAAP